MPKTRQQTKSKMTKKGKQTTKSVKRKPTKRSAKAAKNATIKSNQSSKFDLNADMWSALFTSPQYSVSTHIAAQERDAFKYLATMRVMKRNGVIALDVCKVRALVAAWCRHDRQLSEALLGDTSEFGVVEVLKAAQVMDSARKARQLERKVAQLIKSKETAGHKGKSRLGRKIVALRININNLKRDAPSKGTLTAQLQCRIAKWTRTIDKEQLQFFALHLPTATWQQLADVAHLNPKKDFTLDWFLNYCYDKNAAPEGTLVRQCTGITADNVNDYVAKIDVPWAFLKALPGAKFNDDSKSRIAEYTNNLDTLLWDYEALQCKAVDRIIESKIRQGATTSLPYGKLMERLLKMRLMTERPSFYPLLMPQAEAMLKDIKLPLQSPVVVIGDASASMDIAIRTSTIVASFLRALTNADLVFFSNEYITPKFVPKTVEEVIELAVATKTVGSTCHASALAPYYEQKRIVKTFIICTDEEENTNYRMKESNESVRFQELFTKYHKEVYPARLVFVSFLHGQHAVGQMYNKLKLVPEFDVCQFKLDHNRPDLTKLNNLVGQLSTDSVEYGTQVSQLSETLRAQGMTSIFEQMQL